MWVIGCVDGTAEMMARSGSRRDADGPFKFHHSSHGQRVLNVFHPLRVLTLVRTHTANKTSFLSGSIRLSRGTRLRTAYHSLP